MTKVGMTTESIEEQAKRAAIRDDVYEKMANAIVEDMTTADLESCAYESVIDGLRDMGDIDLAIEWARLFNTPFHR